MIEFSFRSQAKALCSRRMAKAAVCVAQQFVADAEILHEMDLVLSEAASNVVRHAYESDQPGDIFIRLKLDPGKSILLEVTDWGKGFDTKKACCKQPKPSDEGGRGIFIMTKLADEFEISCEGGRTLVHFVKEVPPEGWKPQEPEEMISGG